MFGRLVVMMPQCLPVAVVLLASFYITFGDTQRVLDLIKEKPSSEITVESHYKNRKLGQWPILNKDSTSEQGSVHKGYVHENGLKTQLLNQRRRRSLPTDKSLFAYLAEKRGSGGAMPIFLVDERASGGPILGYFGEKRGFDAPLVEQAFDTSLQTQFGKRGSGEPYENRANNKRASGGPRLHGNSLASQKRASGGPLPVDSWSDQKQASDDELLPDFLWEKRGYIPSYPKSRGHVKRASGGPVLGMHLMKQRASGGPVPFGFLEERRASGGPILGTGYPSEKRGFGGHNQISP